MVSPVQRRAPKRRIGATRLGQCVNNSFTDDRRFFMTTKPDRSRYSTGRLATIADMSSPALCTASGPKSAGEGERVAVIALHHISGTQPGDNRRDIWRIKAPPARAIAIDGRSRRLADI